jgi:hypothetical protein
LSTETLNMILLNTKVQAGLLSSIYMRETWNILDLRAKTNRKVDFLKEQNSWATINFFNWVNCRLFFKYKFRLVLWCTPFGSQSGKGQLDGYARKRFTYTGPETVQYQDKFRDQSSQDTKSNARLSFLKKDQCMNIQFSPKQHIIFKSSKATAGRPKPTRMHPSDAHCEDTTSILLYNLL